MNNQADEIRTFLVNTALPDYFPAVIVDESVEPFLTDSNKIIHVKQEGRPINGFTREHDCQVSLYSQRSSSLADMNTTKQDAEVALSSLFNQVRVVPSIANSMVIEDVNGPYITKTNRYYYRFTVRVLSRFS